MSEKGSNRFSRNALVLVVLATPLLWLSPLASAVSPSRPVSAAPALAPIPPPANMVSWWPGDGNANDIKDGNSGSLVGGVSFAQGQVEQAFRLSADGYIDAGNAPSVR